MSNDWLTYFSEAVIIKMTTGKIIRVPSGVFTTLDYKNYHERDPNYARIYLHVNDVRTKVVCEDQESFKTNWSRLKKAIYGDFD